MTTFIVALLIVAIALLAFILLRAFFFVAKKFPEPARPNEPAPLVCGPGPALPPGLVNQDITSTVDGGTITGQTIRVIETLDLVSSLVIVAEKDLTIARSIFVSSPLRDTVDIELASRGGKVTIAPGVNVFSGRGLAGTNANTTGDAVRMPAATALATAGGNGGQIRISGVNVQISGSLQSGAGGDGGKAEATAVGSRLIGAQTVPNAGGPEARAIAVGGSGGNGGGILVCARESIKIDASAEIIAGAGGDGGSATATADNTGLAYARGGDAGRGGGISLGADRKSVV